MKTRKELENFYDGQRIEIQNVTSRWNGKYATVLRWTHDNWYVVVTDDRILLALDATRNEMKLVED